MVSPAGDFVYAKFSGRGQCYELLDLLAIFTVKGYDSVSFSFLSPCFFYSLRTK